MCKAIKSESPGRRDGPPGLADPTAHVLAPRSRSSNRDDVLAARLVEDEPVPKLVVRNH